MATIKEEDYPVGKRVLVEKGNPKYEGVYVRRKKRGGLTWILRYTIGNKLVWETLKGNYTKTGAANIRDKRVRAAEEGEATTPDQRKYTYGQAYEHYKSCFAATTTNKRGISSLESMYDMHIKKHFGHLQLKSITKVQVTDWRNYLLDQDKSGLAPTTAKNIWHKAKTIFKRAITDGLYAGVNPWDTVENVSYKRNRERFLSFEEANQVLDYLKGIGWIREWRAAIIALFTGLRPPSELKELVPMGIDMEHNKITVGLVKGNVKGGKKGSTRTVPMLPIVKKTIEEMYKEKDYGQMEQLFPVLNDYRYREAFAPLNEGIPSDRRDLRASPYTFRHTYASWLIGKGAHLKEVQELMGHKTFQMTSDLYAKIADSAAVKAQSALQKICDEGEMRDTLSELSS